MKTYWYVPVIMGALVAFFLLRRDPSSLIEALDFRLRQYELEREKLAGIDDDRIAKNLEAEQRAAEEMERIRREYEAAKSSLDDKKKKEVEELLSHEPGEMAKELEKLMGFRVVIVQDDG